METRFFFERDRRRDREGVGNEEDDTRRERERERIDGRTGFRGWGSKLAFLKLKY